MGKIKRLFHIAVLGALLSLGSVSFSQASCSTGEQACSTNYAVGQTFFGSGGSLDSTCSSSYCAKQSLGETGQGLTGSANYQARAGFNVEREPYIQFIVTAASVNLGLLSDTSTATGTASFSVKAYLASGYSVVTASPAPASGTHNLATQSTATASTPGTEQFGINLVKNTTACGAPTNFGADPVQVPSASYSYGAAAVGYNSCGLFRYVPNSVIASSSESSGETDFTISYIANISNVTPAGQYSVNQLLVATGTY